MLKAALKALPGRTVCSLLILGVAWAGDASAGNYYRYKNADGKVVMGETLPAGAEMKGYTILDSSGSVLEVVPPKPTGADKLAEEEAERRRLRDEALLSRYSSTVDIEAARDRKVAEIEARLSILKANIIALGEKLELEQENAANYERRGETVPVSLNDKLQGVRSELEHSQTQVEFYQQEKTELLARFEEDISRFAELQAQVELRRGAYRKQ
jgi:hypothetical protein